jgi:hypothetical protein
MYSFHLQGEDVLGGGFKKRSGGTHGARVKEDGSEEAHISKLGEDRGRWGNGGPEKTLHGFLLPPILYSIPRIPPLSGCCFVVFRPVHKQAVLHIKL